MDPGPLRDVLTAVLGVLTGILSGLFGVGGGVVSQPGMRLLGLAPLVVIGTALPVIVPGAVSAGLRYARERIIHWRAVLFTVPPGLAAAVGGGLLSPVVPGDGHLLQLGTATLLGVSAYRMTRGPDAATTPSEAVAVTGPQTAARPPGDAHPGRADPPPAALYLGIGTVSGLLSGLLGIGGGIIMVPAFVELTRMHVKQAIATSLVCVGLFAVPGTITHVALDHVDWRAAAALIVGVVPGARLGAALTMRAGDRRLRLVVGTFLGATALIYAGSELRFFVSRM